MRDTKNKKSSCSPKSLDFVRDEVTERICGFFSNQLSFLRSLKFNVVRDRLPAESLCTVPTLQV